MCFPRLSAGACSPCPWRPCHRQQLRQWKQRLLILFTHVLLLFFLRLGWALPDYGRVAGWLHAVLTPPASRADVRKLPSKPTRPHLISSARSSLARSRALSRPKATTTPTVHTICLRATHPIDWLAILASGIPASKKVFNPTSVLRGSKSKTPWTMLQRSKPSQFSNAGREQDAVARKGVCCDPSIF